MPQPARAETPEFLRIVRSEAEIPFPRGAKRIHAARWVGDGGPTRWLWTEPTTEPLQTSGGLAWLRQRGALPARSRTLPTRYTVGIIAPCPRCGKTDSARDCKNHGQRGITCELVMVDAAAKNPAPSTQPLKGWLEFAEARQKNWHRRAAREHHRRRGKAPEDLRGVGVVTLCDQVLTALNDARVSKQLGQAGVDARALAGALRAVGSPKADAAAELLKRYERVGNVTAARKIQRLLDEVLTKKTFTAAQRRCIESAQEAARNLERKFSRTVA